MKNRIKLIAAIPMLAMLGACTTAPKALDEPHPDDNAYRWKPLFDKTLSNAEFKAGAWHYDADGYLTPLQDEPIWSKEEYENYVLDLETGGRQVVSGECAGIARDDRAYVDRT